MTAAARCLGFVTGYVCTPDAAPGSSAAHARAEVCMAAVGWIERDAASGLMDDSDLIPVASTAPGVDLTPVLGGFTGYGATASLSDGAGFTRLR
jgi:transglutaminase-like putative cysteine protease